jgi:hypothetical protein
MKLFAIAIFCVVCVVTATSAEESKSHLPENVLKLLDNVEAMTVYRIASDPVSEGVRDFRGYKIIAQADIKEKAVRAELVEILIKGTSGTYGVAKCFNPGYGLRLTKGDTTYDFVICFGCGHLHIYTEPGEDKLEETISESALKPFQAVLKKANIELGDEEAETE